MTPTPSVANSATTTLLVAPTPVTATQWDESSLVLRHDGLGVVSLGESFESVMAVLTALPGSPDVDETQVSPQADRTVQSVEPSLYLQFTNWDYLDAVPGQAEPVLEGPVFHYYLTEFGVFATGAGIRVGSTIGELEAAYPDVRFSGQCDGEFMSFFVDPPEGWPQLPIFGLLDGPVEGAATRIVHIGVGWDRTPC